MADPQTTDPTAGMKWPGLRAKLFPITVVVVGGPWRPFFSAGLRNPYHGNFWQVIAGPLIVLGGRGTHD